MARSKTRTLRRTEDSHLTNPFTPQGVFADEEVAGVHSAALDVLERLGRGSNPHSSPPTNIISANQ